MNQKDIMEIEFYCDDLGRFVTIRSYLQELLTTLWREGEGFSSKRPFGNSGWKYELYEALVKGGAIEGEIDFEGYATYSPTQANDVITQCITYAFRDFND